MVVITFIPYGKQSIDEKDIEEVIKVLKGDWITCGPKVEEFEKSISNYVNSKYSVAVNSGTSALDIAVGSLNLEPRSEIITTPFTFVADSNCILYNKCTPVFVDIDKETFNIDPEKIKEKITSKTKAIIFVDFAGQPCEIDKLKEIAEENDLYLIEDASHSLGGEYKGKKIGNFADLTVFSFHPVKPITTGEGGAVSTNNEEFHKRMKLLRNHGMDKGPNERIGYRYDVPLLGRNYRITDIQCALGISQMKKLDSFIKRRNEIAEIYNKEFENINVTPQRLISDVRSGWHIYPILVENRDEIFQKMRDEGIGANVHYIPIYKFSFYKQFNLNSEDYPNTEYVSSRVLSLPIYPKMNDNEVRRVINTIKEVVK